MVQEREETSGTLTARDGLKLFYRCFKPANERARVVVVHGLGEHSGRYSNVVDTLVPAGFGVWIMDHRGHGQSEGTRGHIMSFADYVEDLRLFMELARGDMADEQKLILVGHSMGGLIAIHFTFLYSGMIDGLTVSSPLLGMIVAVPWLKEKLGLLMSAIYPQLTLGNELDPTKISHDDATIEAYQKDSLVHDRVSARWFTEIVAAIKNAHEQASTLAVPILMQVAGDDHLVNAPSSRDFFNSLDVKDKTIHVYEGLYHEIYNEEEPERRKVLADLRDWLEAHIKA